MKPTEVLDILFKVIVTYAALKSAVGVIVSPMKKPADDLDGLPRLRNIRRRPRRRARPITYEDLL